MRRLLLTLLLALVVLCVGPRATAHSELVSSDPEDGATLSALPASVSLTFTDRIDPNFAQAVVADSADVARPVEPSVSGATMTVPMPRGVPQGTVHVRYRIVSADGHPVAGEISFTAGTPSPTSPVGTGATATTTPTAIPTAPGPVTSDASTRWAYALTGLAAFIMVAGGAAVMFLGRRHR